MDSSNVKAAAQQGTKVSSGVGNFWPRAVGSGEIQRDVSDCIQIYRGTKKYTTLFYFSLEKRDHIKFENPQI